MLSMQYNWMYSEELAHMVNDTCGDFQCRGSNWVAGAVWNCLQLCRADTYMDTNKNFRKL